MIRIQTTHDIFILPADNLKERKAKSVQLVVTSPPYPMIGMWDETFARMDPRINEALADQDARRAYELMHETLTPVFEGLHHVLQEGGIACINVGDATRTMNGRFTLHPNTARITETMLSLGFSALPSIIWKKPTNAPNKFLGSGTLPVNAYVTLEHETILIFRKGGPRRFSSEAEKRRRKESALFYEERNRYFSSFWEITGQRQLLEGKSRGRSAAFPLEIPLRLIAMYSIGGDTVLDPFLGTGTTTLASALLKRDSLGYEIDGSLLSDFRAKINTLPDVSETHLAERLKRHEQHLARSGTEPAHRMDVSGIPVTTRQERGIRFFRITRIEEETSRRYRIRYEEHRP